MVDHLVPWSFDNRQLTTSCTTISIEEIQYRENLKQRDKPRYSCIGVKVAATSGATIKHRESNSIGAATIFSRVKSRIFNGGFVRIDLTDA